MNATAAGEMAGDALGSPEKLAAEARVKKVREVITRTLETYPELSATMLGSHTRPYDIEWRATLEDMVTEGVVLREVRPVERTSGGHRRVFVYSLASRQKAGATEQGASEQAV